MRGPWITQAANTHNSASGNIVGRPGGVAVWLQSLQALNLLQQRLVCVLELLKFILPTGVPGNLHLLEHLLLGSSRNLSVDGIACHLHLVDQWVRERPGRPGNRGVVENHQDSDFGSVLFPHLECELSRAGSLGLGGAYQGFGNHSVGIVLWLSLVRGTNDKVLKPLADDFCNTPTQQLPYTRSNEEEGPVRIDSSPKLSRTPGCGCVSVQGGWSYSESSRPRDRSPSEPRHWPHAAAEDDRPPPLPGLYMEPTPALNPNENTVLRLDAVEQVDFLGCRW